VPLACIPVLVSIAGAINNDNLAFLGGAVATLGAWQLVATDRAGWLAVALLGLIAASWAKLTGLLLIGAMLGAVIAYLLWRQRSSWSTLMPVADWMPALGDRNVLQYSMLAIPVAALGCALAGIALSLRRLWHRQDSALDVVVIAGTIALVATFAIHVAYSYGRHLATGWLMDAYPRYYLPLAAIVPLAGLSLLAAVEAPRWHAALLAFWIAGPAIFRVFGAPLG
jgi:hypothetical protein